MKALTLHQPWASLIALRVKTIETRSWPAPEPLIGQHLAIHAAKREPVIAEQIGEWYTGRADNAAGSPVIYGPTSDIELPLGAIVATARLAACVPMVEDYEALCGAYDGPAALQLGTRPDGSPCAWLFPKWGGALEHHEMTDVSDQIPYGEFAPGRWAWLLEDIAPSTERCPACMGGPPASLFPDERCPRSRADHGCHSDGWYDDHGCEWCGTDDPNLVVHGACRVCDGAGKCDPIPARGRQRVWNWAGGLG